MSETELIERLQFIADNATTVLPEEIEEVCDMAAECLKKLKEELEYARTGILSTEAVAKYKATIQDDLKRQIEDLKRENERLRLEHIPKPCNCGAYRGQLTGGWQCPVHGQQW